ncbi:MAG: hypothetical protein ACT4P6_11090 [Gemmatimonadaceae bacterium]
MRTVTVGVADSAWQAAMASHSRRHVLVTVECPPCQRRTLHSLPPVSRSVLRGMVASNLERYFPLSSAALVTDADWIDRKRGAGTARAYALGVDVTSEILAVAAAARCEVVDIRPVDEATRVSSLLPPSELARRKQQELKRLAALAIVTLGISFGATAVAFAGQRALRSSAERTRPPAERVREATVMREELSAAVGAESALVADRAGNHGIAAAIAVVVRALGERDELTLVELANGQLRQVGVLSPNPGPLISALRHSRATARLAEPDAPSLVRRGEEVWTHVLLRAEGFSK